MKEDWLCTPVYRWTLVWQEWTATFASDSRIRDVQPLWRAIFIAKKMAFNFASIGERAVQASHASPKTLGEWSLKIAASLALPSAKEKHWCWSLLCPQPKEHHQGLVLGPWHQKPVREGRDWNLRAALVMLAAAASISNWMFLKSLLFLAFQRTSRVHATWSMRSSLMLGSNLQRTQSIKSLQDSK